MRCHVTLRREGAAFFAPPRGGGGKHRSHTPISYFCFRLLFFFNDTATTEIYTLSLHDALPISTRCRGVTHAMPCDAPARGRVVRRPLRGVPRLRGPGGDARRGARASAERSVVLARGLPVRHHGGCRVGVRSGGRSGLSAP